MSRLLESNKHGIANELFTDVRDGLEVGKKRPLSATFVELSSITRGLVRLKSTLKFKGRSSDDKPKNQKQKIQAASNLKVKCL